MWTHIARTVHLIVGGTLCLTLLLPASGCFAQTRLSAVPGADAAAGSGTITFTAVPRIDSFPLRDNMLLLQAASADGAERYEIHVAAADLLVVRDHARCVRSAARTPHNFKKGVAYRFALKWNGASTAFFINGRKVDEFNLLLVDAFARFRPVAAAGASADFEISNVVVATGSDIADNPDDRKFVQTHRCPDMASLLGSPQQEQFRGVALHAFKDTKTREQIKNYIAVLPPAVAAAIGHVVFVEKNYNPDTAWKGMALPGARTMLVQETSLGSPATFFHEAAHLYDFRAGGAGGAPPSAAWEKQFTRAGTPPDPAPRHGHSVLDQMDGSRAHEEIAAFVGGVYEQYLRPAGAPGNNAYASPDDRAKLIFLREQGFITQAVYERIIWKGGK
jgi:hypothetical protein